MSLGDWLSSPDPERGKLEDVFIEEPPPLSVFVQDKKYLANPPLSVIQYNAVRHIEQIFFPELYPLMVEEWGDYWIPVRFINFATLLWGKGSGKDHVCRICSLRVANLLLCLKSPQLYFGMPEQDTIHMLNVASSSGQAQRAYFKPLTRAVKRGWFKDRCEPSINAVIFDKNVEAISGHSDAESQEGLNLLVGIADEIDAFKTKDEYINRGKGDREPTKTAEGILEMMHTSASTRFETYKRVSISYPRYLGSTIMKLRDEAERDYKKYGEDSREFSSGPHKTWEVNPLVGRGQMVTLESGKVVPLRFRKDYEKDPVLSAAKYECAPSRATKPLFRNTELIAASFSETERDPVVASYHTIERQNRQGGAPAKSWEAKFHFDDKLVPVDGALYAMHGDISVRRDRAGVAMSHVVRWVEHTFFEHDEEGGEVEKKISLPVVKTDFVFSFEADLSQHPQREIQIRWFRELASELVSRGFAIRRYTFDGYQSTDTIQTLLTQGIEAEVLSMDRGTEPYDQLRDIIYDGRWECPYRYQVQIELESIQDLGNKYDHPPNGSKDEADAVCGSVFGAVLLGGAEGDPPERVFPTETEFDVLPMLTANPLEFEDADLDSVRFLF